MANYELGEKIGQGGMGVVYRAHHIGLDRDAAVKFIHEHLAHDDEMVARFLREARLAAKLEHPNVVRVYDIGTDESGRPYIVMELLEGESLRSRLKRGQLTESEALHVASQVLSALGKAHSAGIVHRDVKPGNIHLCPDGTVKLLDFGIAKALAGARLTSTGAQIGTPEYMSPEQAEGKPVDGRSDLYSLGIVLYEMLTGDVPFTADTPAGVAYQHVHQPPPNVPESIAPQTRALLDRLLSKAPQEREAVGAEVIASDGGAPPPSRGSGPTVGSAQSDGSAGVGSDSTSRDGAPLETARSTVRLGQIAWLRFALFAGVFPAVIGCVVVNKVGWWGLWAITSGLATALWITRTRLWLPDPRIGWACVVTMMASGILYGLTSQKHIEAKDFGAVRRDQVWIIRALDTGAGMAVREEYPGHEEETRYGPTEKKGDSDQRDYPALAWSALSDGERRSLLASVECGSKEEASLLWVCLVEPAKRRLCAIFEPEGFAGEWKRTRTLHRTEPPVGGAVYWSHPGYPSGESVTTLPGLGFTQIATVQGALAYRVSIDGFGAAVLSAEGLRDQTARVNKNPNQFLQPIGGIRGRSVQVDVFGIAHYDTAGSDSRPLRVILVLRVSLGKVELPTGVQNAFQPSTAADMIGWETFGPSRFGTK